MVNDLRQAAVLVFPGALNALNFEKFSSEEYREKYRKERESEDYKTYCENLKKLCSRLKNGSSDILLYLVGPSPIGYGSYRAPLEVYTHNYLEDLDVSKRTEKVFWDMGWSCTGAWRSIGRYENPGKIIRPSKHEHFAYHNEGDFDWKDIKANGIEMVLLGGEESVDSDGDTRSVVQIAKEMIYQGLKVIGLKNCVYPLKPKMPLPNRWGDKDEQIMKMLYEQAVEI